MKQRKIQKNHNFDYKKSLGQNFLTDPNICPKMAQYVLGDNTGVLEIGPGAGALTKELCLVARKVLSIEIDKRLKPDLDMLCNQNDNLTVIYDDIMNLDIQNIVKEHFCDCSKIYVCANLPYYITSPVIMLLLEARIFNKIIVMVQKEAADRLCAPVGTRLSGAITVGLNLYGSAEELFFVPRDCFTPIPNVDSAVIEINTFTDNPYKIENTKDFFSFVKKIFSQRRKSLSNSLVTATGIEKSTIIDKLKNFEVETNARAENLDMSTLVKLYKDLKM